MDLKRAARDAWEDSGKIQSIYNEGSDETRFSSASLCVSGLEVPDMRREVGAVMDAFWFFAGIGVFFFCFLAGLGVLAYLMNK